ncbi:hypothetical protein JET18_16580 [Chryseobacterium sp. L7]|uniref:Uncharacterized protein n=1 Tax=Chryseobacterium endalhagicum TaxID=2797638 RepID=A0ABS1QIM8_9FLAO|nr:hypothetical protein [Chryseobacterium endalhagicum]MBL1222471.1 hypothetical protein [Chryseobacterium endalhagicum]
MTIIERNEENFKHYGSTLHEEDLIYLLNKYVEPISDRFYGDGYCASVTLDDGTFLPCVVFRHKRKAIENIYHALHEKRYGIIDKKPYDTEFVQRGIIEHGLVSENILKFDADVVKVETCEYAMPEKIIQGMSSTPTHYFLVKFKDGTYENFRQGEGYFYEVPAQKKLEDIVEIFNSTLILQNDEIIELKNLMDWKKNEAVLKKIHIARPYFVCYIGNSDCNDFAENINHLKKGK